MIKLLAFLVLLSLTHSSLLPDKIPSFVYGGVRNLLAGVANGYSLTASKVEDECMDLDFQILMNDAYYYAFKAQSQHHEPLITKTRGLLYQLVERVGLRSSRNESKMDLLQCR